MTYISWSSDFSLVLEDYVMDIHHMWAIDSLFICGLLFPIIVYVGHCDLYFTIH